MLTRNQEEPMRLVIKIAATLLILAGVMWFLQGINVVPGSLMTGDRKWAIIGAASVLAGVAAWVFAARRA
jgi:TRAP-type mannitol/chloroaromatic compound transport system permease small subunit